jgi:hypothetical protein
MNKNGSQLHKLKLRIAIDAIATLMAILSGLSSDAYGGLIQIFNHTSNPDVGKSNLVVEYRNDASPGPDIHDGHFLESPYTNALEISSMEPGFKAGINAIPFSVTDTKFDLGVKGSIAGSIDNTLYFTVLDPAGLDNFDIFAYNTLNPSTLYSVDKTPGVYTAIPLPDLQNRGSGQYAEWCLTIPEPATLTLLALAAILLRRKELRF